MNQQAKKLHLLQQKQELSKQMARLINRMYRLETKVCTLMEGLEDPVHRVVETSYQSFIRIKRQLLSYTWKRYLQVQEQLKRLEKQ